VNSQNLIVYGLIPNRAIAATIVTDLHRAGFENEDISLSIPESACSPEVVVSEHSKAPEGAVAGGTTGGLLGGALGVLAGIGVLVVPGFGPFLAAGPIIVGLSGVAVGTAVGSLTGALIGMGIPEFEARVVEGKVTRGVGLLAVHVEDARRGETARNVLQLHLTENVAWTGETRRHDTFVRASEISRGRFAGSSQGRARLHRIDGRSPSD